ncbi:MAG: hypothetical protein NT118_11065 [Lentisphaerae bacterium]|nr:hypothetical protein [Lentisphaerota bacterium]
MSSEIQNGKNVACSKCGTENSFGNYECINCREVLSYGEAEEPEPGCNNTSGEDDTFKKRSKFIRRWLLNIPPFIILLFLLTLYLRYEDTILLLVTIVIFMPWCIFCGIDIYNYKDWHESKKDEEKREYVSRK